MSKVRPPYPAEFRQQMVELVRAGRSPTELSREFGVTDHIASRHCLSCWANGEANLVTLAQTQSATHVEVSAKADLE